jgi:membrane protease YdiL (CAAX protease family)
VKPRIRVPLIALTGILLALYSYFYTSLRLWPQIPYGTVGLALMGDVVPLLVAPLLIVRLVLREPVQRFGWSWPGWRRFAGAGVAAYLAVLPMVVWLSQRPEFPAYYPSRAFPPAREHVFGLVFSWLVHHAPQLLAAEAMWRGYLFFPIVRQFGPVLGVAWVTPLYVALHLGRPPLELLLATWAGLVFMLVAWRTRSLLPSFLAHWLVAVTMDALCFARLHG